MTEEEYLFVGPLAFRFWEFELIDEPTNTNYLARVSVENVFAWGPVEAFRLALEHERPAIEAAREEHARYMRLYHEHPISRRMEGAVLASMIEGATVQSEFELEAVPDPQTIYRFPPNSIINQMLTREYFELQSGRRGWPPFPECEAAGPETYTVESSPDAMIASEASDVLDHIDQVLADLGVE